MGAEQNVVALLAEAAERCSDRPALTLRGDRGVEQAVTFAELWEQVDRTSAGLRHAGLSAGDRTILMIPMSIHLYVALLAVLKCGAIAVFVDPWVGRKQIAAFASFAKATAWIGVPKSHLLRLLDSSLRKIPLTVTTGRRLWGWGAGWTLARLLQHPGDQRIANVATADSAMITFTSGSSGLPKGVNRTHGFLRAQHAALQAEFPQLDDDIDMPMFPVFALNNLARGIPSVIPRMDFRQVDRVDGAELTDQMRRHGTTTCTASPPFVDRLAEFQQRHPRQRIALRRILTGGAPVSDRQLEDWRRVWPDTELIIVYGSTEAEPVAHIHADKRLGLRPASPQAEVVGYCIGQPSPQIELRVVRIHNGPIVLDERGWDAWELPCGEAGELLVRGDHVAESYFQNSQATRENKITDADGAVWHRMGDTGYRDNQGYVWLVGRVHSTIYRDGCPVHPQLVEQAGGAGTNAVQRIAALGLPDPLLGERVVVVVESRDDNNELLAQVRSRIQAAGLPVDEVRPAVGRLPLDPRHRSKIDYAALRKQLK